MTIWKIKPLSDVCEFQRGLTYSKSDEVDTPGQIVLRATNIDLASNRLNLEELKFIAAEVKIPLSKLVRPGSLLVCTASGSKSHLGKVAFIDEDYGYAFGGFMGQITPKPDVDGRFIFHALTSPDYKKFIDELSDGININNLKFDDLGRFPLPIPTLPEQHRIVTILDEAFEAIAIVKANAEKNLQNARELFESQLESLFAADGAKWPERPLEKVANIINGYAFKSTDFQGDHGIKSIKITNVGVREFVDDAGKNLPSAFSQKHPGVIVTKGSIVLALTRTIIAGGLKVAVVPSEFHGALLNQRVAAIQPHVAELEAPFLYAFLSTRRVFNYVKSRVNTLMQPNLSIADLRQLPLPLPAMSKQRELMAALNWFDDESQRLGSVHFRKLTALDELKRSLLHEAFTGALTAKSTDKQLEAVA